MATGIAGTNARELGFQASHYYKKTVNFSDLGIATGVPFGAMPMNAEITSVVVKIKTVFNAGTTNVLAMGTTGIGQDIVAAADVNEAALGSTTVLTGNALSFPVDTPLFVSFTQTGTVATTGKAVIIVNYVVDNDQ